MSKTTAVEKNSKSFVEVELELTDLYDIKKLIGLGGKLINKGKNLWLVDDLDEDIQKIINEYSKTYLICNNQFDKNEIKQLGGRFDKVKNCWYCLKYQEQDFLEYIDNGVKVYYEGGYNLKNVFKEAGLNYDGDLKIWYGNEKIEDLEMFELTDKELQEKKDNYEQEKEKRLKYKSSR